MEEILAVTELVLDYCLSVTAYDMLETMDLSAAVILVELMEISRMVPVDVLDSAVDVDVVVSVIAAVQILLESVSADFEYSVRYLPPI